MSAHAPIPEPQRADRRDGVVRLVAVLAALLLMAVLTVRSTEAAFTDTTDNTGSTLSAGHVELTDDDGGSALFTLTYASDAATSDTGCLQVTYAGSITLTSPVTLAVATVDTAGGPGAPDGDGLSDDVDLRVRIGDAGSTCSPLTTTGPVLFDAKLDTWAGAVDTWTPGPGDLTRAFEFRLSHAGLPNDAQGDSTAITFTWTASS